jgi:hypothetical protein
MPEPFASYLRKATASNINFWIFQIRPLSFMRSDKPNEPLRGKPRGIFKGKINFIAVSCGELNPANFASLLK